MSRSADRVGASAVSRPAAAAPFEVTVRVYYEDTDAQGVVYFANYMKFMERCRSDWLRHLGFDVGAIVADLGVVFAVRSSHVDFLGPARLSDLLTVTLALKELRKASVSLEQCVYRGDALLCRGLLRLACVDAAGFDPVPIPGALTTEINKWKMP